jgi:hypothetical protein
MDDTRAQLTHTLLYGFTNRARSTIITGTKAVYVPL